MHESPPTRSERPLLLVDIDGVLSLFGFPPGQLPPAGAFHWIDGIAHFLSTAAAQHLLDLVSSYDLVWASGWEEKADEYLPHLLGLPRGLPHLSFERGCERAPAGAGGVGGPGPSETGASETRASETGARVTRAHWKLAAIDAHAGPTRPLAWIDDAFDESCHAWAAARPGPTLLVATEPHAGLTARDAAQLRAWSPSSSLA